MTCAHVWTGPAPHEYEDGISARHGVALRAEVAG
jgi:hypothetical protein